MIKMARSAQIFGRDDEILVIRPDPAASFGPKNWFVIVFLIFYLSVLEMWPFYIKLSLKLTAFLSIFKRLRQAQAPSGRLSRHRLRHQPAWTGTTGSCRHIAATTGTIPALTGPDSKIIFLYQHLRKYSISLYIC